MLILSRCSLFKGDFCAMARGACDAARAQKSPVPVGNTGITSNLWAVSHV